MRLDVRLLRNIAGEIHILTEEQQCLQNCLYALTRSYRPVEG